MKKIISICLVLCMAFLSACSLPGKKTNSDARSYNFENCLYLEYNQYVLSEYIDGELRRIAVFHKEKNELHTKLLDLGPPGNTQNEHIFSCFFFEGDTFYIVRSNLVSYDLTADLVAGSKQSIEILSDDYIVDYVYAHTDTEIVLSAARADEVKKEQPLGGQRYEAVTIRAQRDGSSFKELEKKIEVQKVLEVYEDFSVCQYMDETTLEKVALFQNENDEKVLVQRISPSNIGWFFDNGSFHVLSSSDLLSYNLSAVPIEDSATSTMLVPDGREYMVEEMLYFDDEMIYVSAYRYKEKEKKLQYFAVNRDGSGLREITKEDIPK